MSSDVGMLLELGDGAQRQRGLKIRIVTLADRSDYDQVAPLAEQVTGRTVERAYVDLGYTRPKVADVAQ